VADLLSKLKLGGLDKKKILMIAAIGVAILYLDFAVVLKLQLKWIKNTSPKIVKLSKDIADLNKELANTRNLQDKEAKIRQKAASKGKKIISAEEIPLLLQHISDIANKNNANMAKMTPAKDKESKPKAPKNGSAAAAAASFGQATITLDLSCSYHNLGKFINDLENLQEFVAVEEMKITHGADDYVRQNVSLTLKTNVRK